MTIKTCFKSRYTDGLLVEADYKQLEIRVLALATRDKKLIDDLLNEVDLHRVFASEIFNKPESAVTEHERTQAKGFSFQLQYGASAKSIAEFWNVDIGIVRKFINEYYERYNDVYNWQQNNITLVNSRGSFEGKTQDVNGNPMAVRQSVIPSIWPESDWGSFSISEKFYSGNLKATFPGTLIKNYPIQGGAADIVLLMLNLLRKEWGTYEDLWTNGKLINTVHDSFLCDVEKNAGYFTRELKRILESVPEVIKDTFGVDSPIPFPVDIKVGETWATMTPFTS